MDISTLNKADVLAALYNAAQAQGFGLLQNDPIPMEREEAEQLLQRSTYFDYVKGRVMKIDLSKDELDTRLYNRDNGPDAAETVIQLLINTNDVNVGKEIHDKNTQKQVQRVANEIDKPTTREGNVINLGYDSNPALKEAVDRLQK